MQTELECIRRSDTCDRDCGKCELVMPTGDLLDAYNHVLDLLTAELDERMIIMPIKPGDVVWETWYDPCHEGATYPDSYDCEGCPGPCDIKKAVHKKRAPSKRWILDHFCLSTMPGFYYLTKEAAEAALDNLL